MSDGIQPTCCRTGSEARRRTLHKSLIAAVAVALLIVVAVYGGRGAREKSNAATEFGDRPQDLVAAMVDAAQRGDLAAFDAKAATSDSDALRVMQHIHDQRSELTGHVVSDVSMADDATASLVLELVYRGDNERYKFDLKRTGDRWTVVKSTPVGRFAPEIPYGTVVDR